MPIRRGTALIVVGIAAVFLLALIFVVPALINADRYRPQVISYLQEKTGKQVEIGRLALTFFPVTIHVVKSRYNENKREQEYRGDSHND